MVAFPFLTGFLYVILFHIGFIIIIMEYTIKIAFPTLFNIFAF